MPTLFKKEWDDGRAMGYYDGVRPGMEWVVAGEGEATEMVDGEECAIWSGKLYRRKDFARGEDIPSGVLRARIVPDPLTGLWPHWVAVNVFNEDDERFVRAWFNTSWATNDTVYVAVGKHFCGNPYGLDDDFLERVGRIKIKDCPRDYKGIREYLRTHEIKGIVWWRDGKPMCKVERSGFGFEWPVMKGE